MLEKLPDYSLSFLVSVPSTQFLWGEAAPPLQTLIPFWVLIKFKEMSVLLQNQLAVKINDPALNSSNELS